MSEEDTASPIAEDSLGNLSSGATATSSRRLLAFPEAPLRPGEGAFARRGQLSVQQAEAASPRGWGCSQEHPSAAASLALRVCGQHVDESSGERTLSPSDSVT